MDPEQRWIKRRGLAYMQNMWVRDPQRVRDKIAMNDSMRADAEYKRLFAP